MPTTCQLAKQKCTPCEGGVAPLGAEKIAARMEELEGWQLNGTAIEKSFRFTNHFELMAFINAIAWVSHREDHHPEITLGYADCRVRYWTHAIGGLSENDFICAAKIEALQKL